MSPLTQMMRAKIAKSGPLNIAEFMAQCLYHPQYGYYRHAPVLGGGGDFITAPEISQSFGELLGLCLAHAWQIQGAPNPFNLVELGPGTGQLLLDALRASKQVKGFEAAMRLHMIECNHSLRKQQSTRLAALAPQAVAPQWHDSQTTLPDGPLFVIANEFFDCLPIRQFIRTPSGWGERMVAVQKGALCFVQTKSTAAQALDHHHADNNADFCELRHAANALLGDLARQIARYGGGMLVIDYGAWGSHANTLQAIYKHQKSNPLAHLGQSDLTAWVDFAALAQAAMPFCAYSKLTAQGVFLERLGISTRMQNLAQNLSGAELQSHIAAHERLCHPKQMGELFKVLGLWPKDAPALIGLEAA